jgi:hypothetical protein
MPAPDLLGSTFGLLRVVAREKNKPDGSSRWKCICACGETRIVAGTGLRAGRHKSCGCASPRFTSDRMVTHNLSRSREYKIWQGMKIRCSDSAKGKTRRNYYAKGIRVCDRWMSFDAFINDMGMSPVGSTIERVDGSIGYNKQNCRWATRKEQANNTTRNVRVDHDGVSLNISQWAERLGIKPNTLLYRLRRGTPKHLALVSTALRSTRST